MLVGGAIFGLRCRSLGPLAGSPAREVGVRADFSSAPSPARHGDSAEKPSWSHDSGDIRACGNLWKKSPRRSPSPVEKNGRGIKNSASHLLGRHSKFVKELSEPINFPSFRAQGCRSEESRLLMSPELISPFLERGYRRSGIPHYADSVRNDGSQFLHKP